MLRQRQLNVQQQNALVEKSILDGALYWRDRPLPIALKICGEERGVVWDRSIVVDLDIDCPGMPRLFGLLLTQDELFIDFAIDTDTEHRVVNSVDEWNVVTTRQSLSLKNRGTGAGRGALALKVLRALNAKPSGGQASDGGRPPNKSMGRMRER